MSAFSNEAHRQIIPRWRYFSTTSELGELSSAKTASKKVISDQRFFLEKLDAWRLHRSSSFAADLVGAAIVFGQFSEASDAATFLLEGGPGVPNAAKSLASQLISLSKGNGQLQLDLVDPIAKRTTLQPMVALLRNRAKERLRDSITWIDLAFTYVVLGMKESAFKPIRIALSLDPNNRFVIRSAVRYFLHIGDGEQALQILRKSDATKGDPWLAASEIAVSSVLEKMPRCVKQGKEMAWSGHFSKFHVSELLSALGTIELNSGSSRNTRKFIAESLIEPTENVLAQAEWVSKQISGIGIPVQELNVPRRFEALARHYSQLQEWRSVTKPTWNWLFDQPFSSRPAAFGSYVAGVFLDDYSESEKFARAGLMSNGREPTLLNNLAFACACANKINEATQALSLVPESKLTLSEEIAVTATKGLIEFRRGNPVLGRQYYLKAIEKAEGPSFYRHRVLAAYFLVKEEMIAKTSDSNLLRLQVLDQTKAVNDPDLRTLLSRLNDPNAFSNHRL